MSRIRVRCPSCGGVASFLPEEQDPHWIGMVGFCWCGQAYRLDCGELTTLSRRQELDGHVDEPAAEPTVDLRDGDSVLDPIIGHVLLGALSAVKGCLETARRPGIDAGLADELLDDAGTRLDTVLEQLQRLTRGLPLGHVDNVRTSDDA